eukprot:CCRYP_005513-RA/>CCRYP_005513-RA protein AED:0.34 eAED:0.34 QI:0/0/0/1/1/1/2/0/152
MYMESPPGMETKHGNSKDYCLKLPLNIYGQNQAGRVWNQYMLHDSGLNIEDQGHPADYAGVNIKKTSDVTYESTQRALIDAIIDDINIGASYTKQVPANVTLQLHAIRDSPKFQTNFNYHSAMGKLMYLGQTTRLNIMYMVHQVAKYSADPR